MSPRRRNNSSGEMGAGPELVVQAESGGVLRSEGLVRSARPSSSPDHLSGQDNDKEREEKVSEDAF